MSKQLLIITIILLISPATTLHARIIHVPGDKPTIQAGINVAVDGDTVMVDPGTYDEHEIDFLGKAITVTGTDPEDSSVVAATIVDGNAFDHVFNFHSGEGPSSLLVGLTIQNAEWYGIRCEPASPTISHNLIMENGAGGIGCYESSPLITHNTIDGNDGGVICESNSTPNISDNRIVSNSGRNGGIYISDSSPLVLNNIIRDNEVYTGIGGGIICYSGSPVIISNSIQDNRVWTNENGPPPKGGGLHLSGSTGIIANNIISGNYVHDYANEYGTVHGSGGGIYCASSTLTISGNTISGNTAETGLGGGIYSVDCWLVITGNRVQGNRVEGSQFGLSQKGAGLYFYGSTANISNNIISGNEAQVYMGGDGGDVAYGGGIYSDASVLTLANNTITGNRADTEGGGLFCESTDNNPGSDVTIFNTVLWDNSAPVGSQITIQSGNNSTILTIYYSDVEGGRDSVRVDGNSILRWGPGMIDVDPLYADSSYHLQSNSPCVDAGNPDVSDNCLPPGLGLERSDMGAYGGEENCGWATEIDLSFYPDELVNVTREDTLEFNTYIYNNNQNDFTGDCWFSLLMPDSSEVLVPEDQMNYPNPLPVMIPPLLTFDLAGLLFITGEQDTGSYQLIGRVGSYPDSIVDEEALAFRVYRPGIIHVPADHPTIQGAIDESLDGDTVLVADGIYTGDGNRDIDFQGRAIILMSENGPEATIIDCDGSSVDPHRGFTFTNREGPASMVRGFTITNGFNNMGGGFYCVGLSSPTITECVITGNSVFYIYGGRGGGIYCSYSSPTITDCVIIGNLSDGDIGGYGGGIYFDHSDLEFRDNVITGNYAGGSYGGGGISCYGSDLVIRNNRITGNSAAGSGGGVRCSNSDLEITDNVITGNSAGIDGGGIIISNYSDLLISDNRITGNAADEKGGGIYSESTSMVMFGNTITGNLAGVDGGGISSSGSYPRISNSIIWDNSPTGISGTATVTYSDVQGGRPGEGNIEEDPLFLRPGKQDYRLLWGSPCIDTGDPDYLDPDMTRSDMGTFFFDQNEQITLYLTPDMTEIVQGGQLGVTYTLINRWEQPEAFLLETDVILPDGLEYDLFGPDEYTLPPGRTVQVHTNHDVPPVAPTGEYEYRSRTDFPLATVPGEDRFTFRVVE